MFCGDGWGQILNVWLLGRDEKNHGDKAGMGLIFTTGHSVGGCHHINFENHVQCLQFTPLSSFSRFQLTALP